MIPKKYYTVMTDKFMSGWGRAEHKKNKYIIESDSYEKAQLIAKNARLRREMKHVNIHFKKPYYNKSRYLMSIEKFEDLGDIWKK